MENPCWHKLFEAKILYLVYLITPEPSSKETVDIEIPTKIEFSVDQVSEKNMLELVNREREKRGL